MRIFEPGSWLLDVFAAFGLVMQILGLVYFVLLPAARRRVSVITVLRDGFRSGIRASLRIPLVVIVLLILVPGVVWLDVVVLRSWLSALTAP